MKDFKERFRETMKKYGVTREKVAVAVVVILAAVLLICLLAILATAIKPLLGLAAGIGVVLLIFTDFWERLFRRLEAAKQPPAPFPVYFGFEDGRIVPHLVDEIFGSLYRRFETCYFTNWCETENRLVYAFKCVPKPDAPVDYEYLQLLQKQAEGIISHELGLGGITGVACQNIVVVDFVHGTLYISLAKNNLGIQEVLSLQANIRRKYLADAQPADDDFSDKWKEE